MDMHLCNIYVTYAGYRLAMNFLPLSKSKHMLPFAALLSANGENVHRLLKQASLSADCLEDPDTLIPGVCEGSFRELAAQKLGRPNISLEATRHLEIEDLGDFGKVILKEPTLRGSISRFQQLAATESSWVAFDLYPQPDGGLWFGQRLLTHNKTGEWHNNLYLICLMLKVARLADPTWSPTEILLNLQAAPEQNTAIEMLGSTPLLEQAVSGFMIPASMLALPVAKSTMEEEVTEAGLWSTAPPQTFAESLRQLIRSFAKSRWLSVDEAGELSGQSARTLQRRLSTEQITYSNLVQQCRLEMAGDLLENSNATIADIAYQLGYSNQGNFTRAFYRWAKVSPREFRKHRATAH